MSVMEFHLTGDSTGYSSAHTGVKDQISALLIPCGEKPRVTNGFPERRTSNQALIM